jgi:hypothetical protein
VTNLLRRLQSSVFDPRRLAASPCRFRALGDFHATLTPIPPFAIPGTVGFVAVLWEQVGSSDDTIAAGHQAFNSSLQSALNALIPTFSLSHQQPTPADIQNVQNQITSAVTSAIKGQIGTLGQILTFLGLEAQDVNWGSPAYIFDGGMLASLPPSGLVVNNGFPNPVTINDPDNFGSVVFTGTVTSDPVPVSLSRILKRLGQTSLRAAIAASSSGPLVPP